MLLKFQKPLSFYTKRSTYVHVILLISVFGISKKIWFDHKKMQSSNIKLVKSSVRVDMVAMPKLTIKELQTLNTQIAESEPAKVEKVVEASKTQVVEETSKIEFEKVEKKKNFMDMLKDLSKKKVDKVDKKKIVNSDTNSTGKNKIDYSKLNKLVIEGNKLSEGTSLVGGDSTEAQEALGAYMTNLRDEVKVFWKLPSYLLNKDYQCRVRVYISQSGKLVKAEIFESSGNDDYDAKALEAVRLSAPFPSVAKDISDKVSRGEILLGFPL